MNILETFLTITGGIVWLVLIAAGAIWLLGPKDDGDMVEED